MPENKDKLLVIIPAYNESESICKTVSQLMTVCTDIDYIVVDDGSTDTTSDICIREGYPLLHLPVNLGLSGAFQAGVKYAKEKGYGYVLQFDADGQHLPQYIVNLWQRAKEGADVVIGSRYLQKNKEHSLRRFGGKLISAAIFVTTGKKIYDPTSGMRLYSSRLINGFSGIPNFDPEPDMIAYLIHRGYRVEEVAVTMEERVAGQSYLRLGRVVQYMLRMLLSILLIQWFRRS